MSLQRKVNRAAFRKDGEPWPKSATLDRQNEGLSKVGVTLHPTKGYRTRAEWRDDAAKKAAKGAPKRSLVRRLIDLLAA